MLAKNIHHQIFKIAHFLMLHNSSTFLVLDYEEDVFRSFNSGSIELQRESALSAVGQLAASKDNLLKYCFLNLYKSIIIFKNIVL